MCGILGISAKKDIDYTSYVHSGLQIIGHRGPESKGIFQHQQTYLGHRRLKIIDTSDCANQPMTSQCERYIIIFNGEIYNFLELKQALKQLGYTFQTASDTEVILQAYRHWGESCVDKFNGIWAFSILDRTTNKLFLSRDRFGVKPLYHCSSSNFFAFSSEIKALLPLFNTVKENEQRVIEFLIYGKSEDASSTFFDDIYKLPGGHNLIYDINTQQFELKRYYTLCQQANHLSPQQTLNKTAELIQNSINYQIRSDVPIGVSLSGGLDSSAITQLVSKKINSSLSAFTAISEDSQNSELPYAKSVVDSTNTNWIQAKPNYNEFVSHLDDVVYTQEEPFSTASIIMQYFLMKQVNESHIKVILDGQGADEIFLGYERYVILEIIRSLHLVGCIHLIKNIKKYMANNSNLSIKKLVYYSLGSAFPRMRQQYMNYRMGNYLSSDIAFQSDYIYNYAQNCKKSCFDLQKLEIEQTNLPALLRFADKNSMRFSVEDRVPFLDHQLVEFCVSLPLNEKIADGWSKWQLRKNFDKKLPDGITWRKNKIGYEAPEKTWISRHRPVMRSAIIDSNLLNTYCNKSNIKKSFDKIDDRSLWRLYSAALWGDKFLSHG